MSLNEYLAIPYVDCGRDRSGADCWGLVRLVAHEVYGLPWLPAFEGVSVDDKAAFTLKHNELSVLFCKIPSPEPGDILAAYLGDQCVHVGIGVIADGHFRVMHTRRHNGPRLDKQAILAAQHRRVSWWRYGTDNHLS